MLWWDDICRLSTKYFSCVPLLMRHPHYIFDLIIFVLHIRCYSRKNVKINFAYVNFWKPDSQHFYHWPFTFLSSSISVWWVVLEASKQSLAVFANGHHQSRWVGDLAWSDLLNQDVSVRQKRDAKPIHSINVTQTGSFSSSAPSNHGTGADKQRRHQKTPEDRKSQRWRRRQQQAIPDEGCIDVTKATALSKQSGERAYAPFCRSDLASWSYMQSVSNLLSTAAEAFCIAAPLHT